MDRDLGAHALLCFSSPAHRFRMGSKDLLHFPLQLLLFVFKHCQNRFHFIRIEVGEFSAQFVFVGRPMLFAAIAGGEAGVTRALTLLRDEVDRDMALLGIRSIGEISSELVRKF